jgi:hypothetical protein
MGQQVENEHAGNTVSSRGLHQRVTFLERDARPAIQLNNRCCGYFRGKADDFVWALEFIPSLAITHLEQYSTKKQIPCFSKFGGFLVNF